jgi:hypothetical protein
LNCAKSTKTRLVDLQAVFLRLLDFSMRIHGIIFMCYETVSLEVFYKVTVITLVDIDFGRKNNANHFRIGL